MGAPGPDQVHGEYAMAKRLAHCMVHVLHKREFRTCTSPGMASRHEREREDPTIMQMLPKHLRHT